MSQGSWQPVRVGAPPTGVHRVAMIVDADSNPFEVGCACEVFGAPVRASIGRALYDFRVVAPRRGVRMRDGLFTIDASGTLVS